MKTTKKQLLENVEFMAHYVERLTRVYDDLANKSAAKRDASGRHMVEYFDGCVREERGTARAYEDCALKLRAILQGKRAYDVASSYPGPKIDPSAIVEACERFEILRSAVSLDGLGPAPVFPPPACDQASIARCDEAEFARKLETVRESYRAAPDDNDEIEQKESTGRAP